MSFTLIINILCLFYDQFLAETTPFRGGIVLCFGAHEPCAATEHTVRHHPRGGGTRASFPGWRRSCLIPGVAALVPHSRGGGARASRLTPGYNPGRPTACLNNVWHSFSTEPCELTACGYISIFLFSARPADLWPLVEGYWRFRCAHYVCLRNGADAKMLG